MDNIILEQWDKELFYETLEPFDAYEAGFKHGLLYVRDQLLEARNDNSRNMSNMVKDIDGIVGVENIHGSG